MSTCRNISIQCSIHIFSSKNAEEKESITYMFWDVRTIPEVWVFLEIIVWIDSPAQKILIY